MNTSRRDFLKGLMVISALGVIEPKEILLFINDEKIYYSESEWFQPEDQAIKVKYLMVVRPHKIKEIQKDGYMGVITIADREPFTEKIYRIKKKQTLYSLYDLIQQTEKLRTFELVKGA